MKLVAASLLIAASQPPAKPTQAPAAKPTPPPTDLNCLIASNVFALRETDQQRKQLAHQALIFYLGRLEPRITEPELKSAMKRTADGLNGVNAASLMNECLVDLRSKASMLETAAKELQQGK